MQVLFFNFIKIYIMKAIQKSLFFFTILFLVYSCSPKVTKSLSKSYTPLDYNQEVKLLELEDEVPTNFELLGEIKIGDTGFTTKCDYNTVIEEAKLEARKVGGNIVKITDHKSPDFNSSCHRIAAKIYKAQEADLSKLNVIKAEKIDSVLLKDSAALIHFYRIGSYGFAVTYNIYLGNDKLTRVKANWKETVKVTKDGYNSIWAKTESKSEIPIKIEYGKEYYVRCGISMGLMVGRPKIELVSASEGKTEFNKIKSK